jgi:pseudaminic acid synthase
LLAFSSPFDGTAVDFLESLEVPAYKIASFEIIDIPLIQRVAATGKPMIISTGMATLAEIDEAVRAAREAGCDQLALLKCTSSYPATPAGSNLNTIPHLASMFGCQVGLSDHTLGIGVPVASVAMGATIIEKHFTLARNDGGVDSAFSLEPTEMQLLVAETERAWQAMGMISYGPSPQERSSRGLRRSLYITEDLKVGDVVTPKNLRAIRPGKGLPPKYFDMLLGQRLTRDVKRGTAAAWDLFKD